MLFPCKLWCNVSLVKSRKKTKERISKRKKIDTAAYFLDYKDSLPNKYIQFPPIAYIRSLNRPYGGHFKSAKHNFKTMTASWFVIYFFKRFRYFNSKNMGSVGQRGAKLLSVKLWEWFDPGRTQIWAEWFEWGQTFSWDLELWKLVTLQPFNQ